MKFAMTFLVAIATMTLISGCAKDEKSASHQPAGDSTAEKVDSSEFLLASEPAEAKAVGVLRESSKDNDEVVIVGRIGGSTHPWVDGAAAFTIVDESLAACGDEEECGCPTPWDYCCVSSDKIATNSVTVKFTDENQRTRRFNPKDIFGLAELQTVVVEGTVDRDDTGKFTILARKMFIRK